MVHDVPTPDSPRERRRKATQERILEVAMATVLEGGFEALSIHGLAHRLDYTPGALYRYFASKDQLMTALAARAIGALRDEATGGEPLPAEPVARIAAMALRYTRAALGQPHRFALLAMMLAHPGFLVEETSEAAPALVAMSNALDPLVAALAQGESEGGLRAGNPIQRALALFAGVLGVLQLRKQARFSPQLFEVEALAVELVGTLLVGWGADATRVARAMGRRI